MLFGVSSGILTRGLLLNRRKLLGSAGPQMLSMPDGSPRLRYGGVSFAICSLKNASPIRDSAAFHTVFQSAWRSLLCSAFTDICSPAAKR